MKNLLACFVFILILSPANIPAQEVIEADFSDLFGEAGVEGCFVLYDKEGNKMWLYNRDICETGYLPASTFKIPNALIALGDGIVKDSLDVIPWDGTEWPHAIWNRDQTLASALRYSCIWAFFYIAREVGTEKYQFYLDTLNYGNKDLTGPSDRFWLAGELRISAIEQVEFLDKFYTNDLPFHKEHIDLVKHILTVERTESYLIVAKSGAGKLEGENLVMWYVGYLERKGKPYIFAMNFITDDYEKTRNVRQEISKAVFDRMKLLD